MLLHHSEDVFIDRDYPVKRRDEISSQAIDPEEIEANRFAAEILMPLPFLQADLRDRAIDLEDDAAITALAKKYRVSVAAMAFRISNIVGIG